MPYIVPRFPIVCNIFTGPYLAKVLRIGGLACNLGMGRRSPILSPDVPNVSLSVLAQLLLPAGTDVRDSGNASGYDVVECPAGSARYYWVVHVDDMGKGFPNEHRVAWIGKAVNSEDPIDFAGAVWPTPIP